MLGRVEKTLSVLSIAGEEKEKRRGEKKNPKNTIPDMAIDWFRFVP